MYSNQAQSYITDEGNTSSIFGLLASQFKEFILYHAEEEEEEEEEEILDENTVS